ncbi:ribose-phosphate diphosphokinase [Candidatus Uhrbacteria bacterium]|nr:ribose-phosphate diphosphokinase [Candidatus Uhrbacteria bacterium]
MNAYTLPNPRPLELSIAKKLDKHFARNTEWRQFTNGEWFLRIAKKTKRAIVLGRTEPPSDNLLKTLLLLDTLKRNGAKKIILVVPYFGYSRQDRVVRNGDHLPADLFLKLFEAGGATRIITVDLHNTLTTKHSPIPLVSIEGTTEFIAAVKKTVKKSSMLTVVSPDHGGKKRAEQFRNLFNPSLPVCWLKKHRDPKTGTIHAHKLFGDKRGSTALVVDDILDTGTTVAAAVRTLKKHGFKTFYLAVIHPVFSANAVKTLQKIKFKKIFVSNTIPLSRQTLHSLPITVITTTPLIIHAIKELPM